jgi:signal transduction histidine kinase
VTCHIGELNQVFLNMVVNAAHAIAEAKSQSERAGLITIRSRVKGACVEIEIEDNGCGIPSSAIDRIFDPFFTTKEIGKGTGQGLAIAHAVVVEKHAGKINVTSRVGHGTTFAIVLPVLGRDDGSAEHAAVEAVAS